MDNRHNNAGLSISGAIKGRSQIKLLEERGLESLKFKCWFRRLLPANSYLSGFLVKIWLTISKASFYYS